MAISVIAFMATIIMAIIPCVTPRGRYTLQKGSYDVRSVYCRHPDISPRPQPQFKAFTIENPGCELQPDHGQKQLCSPYTYETAQTVLQNRLAVIEQRQSSDSNLKV